MTDRPSDKQTPAPGSAPLSLTGVDKAYGTKQIFSNVSFDLVPGEVFGLVGLNGVGKTSMIRALLGLGKAEGEITLFGEPCTRSQARRNLVYLPEKFMPSVMLKGWEHLSLHLEYFGQKLDRDKAVDLARQLDLDPDALGRAVRTYSKGMGQKLGLVAALLTDVPLMVLDEPMSGLDPRARVRLKDSLMQARDAGRTVFFSSHILADVEEICDRIGILHAGRLAYLGTPADFVRESAAPSLERAFLTLLDRVEAEQAA